MRAPPAPMNPFATVLAYYQQYPEEDRLGIGPFRLEFERTKEILARLLTAPRRIVDVGGAAGAYSSWLAGRGHEVHLVDVVPRLVEEARRRDASSPHPIASFTAADARALPQADASADAVLVMGPLYHLTEAADRHRALREAHRVLVPAGDVVVAAISRYASALDGLATKASLDPEFARIRDRDLADGQHRNETGHPHYFTTAYFHRPEDLRAELEAAGFEQVRVLGVEGPGWLLVLAVARALEAEPSIVGASAHLLGIGRKPSDPV
jgi:ubiquinone/menaquinone biosynthesis C-methylase UbiE